jgi:hypothetical protein
MTKIIQVRASTVSSAQPEELHALLVNSATYPAWSMIRYYESLRSGRDGLHGARGSQPSIPSIPQPAGFGMGSWPGFFGGWCAALQELRRIQGAARES